MKVLILMGSPRLHGNTAELCKPFRDELERGGAEVVYMPLTDKHILPCKACYACQNVQDEYKYYGSANGCLWEGKKVAILVTHGYDAAYATEPFETGIKRLCEHSHLKYIGMYSVRDTDNLASFQTEEAVTGARQFAKEILKKKEI